MSNIPFLVSLCLVSTCLLKEISVSLAAKCSNMITSCSLTMSVRKWWTVAFNWCFLAKLLLAKNHTMRVMRVKRDSEQIINELKLTVKLHKTLSEPFSSHIVLTLSFHTLLYQNDNTNNWCFEAIMCRCVFETQSKSSPCPFLFFLLKQKNTNVLCDHRWSHSHFHTASRPGSDYRQQTQCVTFWRHEVG